MLESRPEDALGSLVGTVETVETVETVKTVKKARDASASKNLTFCSFSPSWGK